VSQRGQRPTGHAMGADEPCRKGAADRDRVDCPSLGDERDVMSASADQMAPRCPPPPPPLLPACCPPAGPVFLRCFFSPESRPLAMLPKEGRSRRSHPQSSNA